MVYMLISTDKKQFCVNKIQDRKPKGKSCPIFSMMNILEV